MHAINDFNLDPAALSHPQDLLHFLLLPCLRGFHNLIVTLIIRDVEVILLRDGRWQEPARTVSVHVYFKK